jgi:hypothetical protein
MPAKKPTLKPFKFVVTGVALKTDGSGKVLGEVTTEPVALYGVEALKEWAEGFEENLVRAAQQDE